MEVCYLVRRALNRFLIILLLLSAGALASSTWTNGKQVVKHIIWKPNYQGFYTSSEKFHDPMNCGTKTSLYVIDPELDANEVDRLYSMLLLAYSTGDDIHLWLSGCQGDMPKFSGLQINKKG